MIEFKLTEEFITLQNLLKFENLASSGGEAKHLIISGLVSVNGETETRRGKKLRKGDTVTIGKEKIVMI